MGKFIKKYRYPAIIIAFFLLLMLLFSFALYTKPLYSHSIAQVNTVTVTPLNKPIQIIRQGSVASASALPVTIESSGCLSEIYVTNGQFVKAGQPLFKILPSAEAPVDPASPAAIGHTAQPQTDYEAALKEFNRNKYLYDIGGIPRRQLEDAANRLQEAQNRLTQSQNQAPTAASASSPSVTSATTITAAVDGIISGLTATANMTVQAGQQLAVLGNGQTLDIVFTLNQNDLYMVHLGTPGTIEAANQEIAGQVYLLEPKVEGNQIASFQAHMKLTTSLPEPLKPGMPVQVYINTGKYTTVAALPTTAILQDSQGRHFVYQAINSKAVRQEITVGETLGEFVEITSDLPEGCLIIMGNLDTIKDGVAIEPLP